MAKKEVAIEDDSDIEPASEIELTKPEAAKTEVTEEETEELDSEAKTPEAPEAPVAEEAAEEEEEIEIVEEKFYDLNLRRIWTAPREKRTPRAVRYVRQYAANRMKTDNVSLSEETNSLLWNRGISKPPRKIRIRVVKDKEGKVIVFPGEGK
ncbi:MAG TPA: 50S ribosomal protein L31e [Candidatus Sulfotelmatobacter sp.]|jgi:large subunit ribosomal protein L31e|nr:50S ribosomal protein L31e [Candidatus Sulfotelmatobacter sp.]